MVQIAHVCLSDLHLGSSTGLLTPQEEDDLADPARVLSKAVAAALTATVVTLSAGSKPGLILLGDVLDLSLGTMPKASAAAVQVLADLAGPAPSTRFGQVYFVPGNHDHELWTAQRYQTYVPSTLSFPHTTRAFDAPDRMAGSTLLNGILTAAGLPASVTYYPNLGLRTSDGDRVVLFHHGHYVEGMYSAMSSVLAAAGASAGLPNTLERLEQVNASWIDFIWSTIGDNGLLGSDATLVYDYLMTGSESPLFQQRLANALASALFSGLPLPKTIAARDLLGLMSAGLVDGAFGSLGQLERFSYMSVLQGSTIAGLSKYLSGPTMAQILSENGAVPKDFTFIFGHTHKPFADRLPVPGYVGAPAIYNTGGWILDTPMFGTCEGASIVFIDTDLNVASLRLFTVPNDDLPSGKTTPTGPIVQTADGCTIGNAMSQALEAVLTKPGIAGLWDAVAKAADAAYRATQDRLMARLRAADLKASQTGTAI